MKDLQLADGDLAESNSAPRQRNREKITRTSRPAHGPAARKPPKKHNGMHRRRSRRTAW